MEEQELMRLESVLTLDTHDTAELAAAAFGGSQNEISYRFKDVSRRWMTL